MSPQYDLNAVLIAIPESKGGLFADAFEQHGQGDLWHPGLRVDDGIGRTRNVEGLFIQSTGTDTGFDGAKIDASTLLDGGLGSCHSAG